MLLFLFIWERDRNRETEYYSARSHPLVHFPNAGNRVCWELKLQSGLPCGWEGPDYLSYYCCLPGKRFVFLAITSLGLSTMCPTYILRSGSTLYPHKNPTRKSHSNLQIRKRAQRSFFFSSLHSWGFRVGKKATEKSSQLGTRHLSRRLCQVTCPCQGHHGGQATTLSPPGWSVCV